MKTETVVETPQAPDPMKIYRDYRGPVWINGEKLEVINFSTFSGCPHWGIVSGVHQVGGQAVLGWIPVALCNMVE